MNHDTETQQDRQLDEALQEAVGEELPAAELRRLRDVLLRRHIMLTDEIATTPDQATRRQLETKIADLEKHISILNEEAAVTQFVEDSVRYGLGVRRLGEG